jgi:NADPH:quinone reductase-like Zn-dependent oxidoreductase
MARVLDASLRSRFASQELGFMMAEVTPDDLALLADLVAKGTLTPVIDRRYPLGEAPAAMEYLEAGHARGKVIITLE